MNKRIDDYQIIYGINIRDIEHNIIVFMNSHDGYELCGGICVTHYETANTEKFYQAVVKYQ